MMKKMIFLVALAFTFSSLFMVMSCAKKQVGMGEPSKPAYWKPEQKAVRRDAILSIDEERTVRIAKKIKNRIGKWMSGQLVLKGVIFILDFTVLYLLGVPYALIVALIGGFLEIIPYIGPTLSAFIAFTVSLLVSPVKAVFVLISYILTLPQITK